MKNSAVAFTQEEDLSSRRLHERVRAHWDSLRENRAYPSEREIDPAMLTDAWPWCFLVDMRKGNASHGFTYEYMGDALVGAYGMNMVSLGNCNAANTPHIASMLRHFEEVRESGEPAMDASVFQNANGDRIHYRCCLLPLGIGKVEYILGCMRWKAD